jgi:predicted transcriptional regulator
MSDERRIIEPQCHEFIAELNINSDGLNPWFAADKLVKEGGGSVEIENATIGVFDCPATVRLSYQESGLVPPEGGKTLAGTEVQHENIREFRIHVEANDGLGLRSVNFHMRPRWANLESEADDGTTTEVSVPESLVNEHTDAVSVRATGSYIPFEDYQALLGQAADALGIRPGYFTDCHTSSTIIDAARYVRIRRGQSGPIHARDGPLVQLAHVLENDRDGYRKIVQNDRDKRGQATPGFYHTATIGPDRVREVWPNHGLPKEVKHYLKDDYHEREDKLKHPKLEAAYQVSKWNDTLYFDDDGIEQLYTELDESLYSVLKAAGIDLRGGDGSPYVDDHYFNNENAMLGDTAVVSLDLAQVRQEQEHVVVKHLAGGLSPVQQEALSTLVTDGGEVSAEDVADEHNRHRESVYRALDAMEHMIDKEYGRLSLRSTYVAELVNTAINEAEEAVSKATAATAEALEAAERGLDERTSAFIAWQEAHGVTFTEKDDSVSLSFGEIAADDRNEARRIVREKLREGLQLWDEMNRDIIKFRSGSWTAHAEVKENSHLRSLPTKTKTAHMGSKIWKTITPR